MKMWSMRCLLATTLRPADGDRRDSDGAHKGGPGAGDGGGDHFHLDLHHLHC